MVDASRLSDLICSTPRSGSTLLCEALALTGVAGVPEEYYQHRRKTGLPRRPLEYFEDAGTAGIFEILGSYTRVDDEPGLFDPPGSRAIAPTSTGRCWMRGTSDPLLDGPVPPPPGAEFNDSDGRSAAETPIRAR